MRAEWEGGYYPSWDANDMLVLLSTWQKGDISKVKPVPAEVNAGTTLGTFAPGDLEACLNSIKVKGLIMPCKTDLYFPVCLMICNLTELLTRSSFSHSCMKIYAYMYRMP